MTDDSFRRIAEALVSTPEHQALYHRSAEFKARIGLLAQMLPMWVDGLAVDAEVRDAQQAAAFELLKASMPMTPWTDLLKGDPDDR